jgi:hypothetical protein
MSNLGAIICSYSMRKLAYSAAMKELLTRCNSTLVQLIMEVKTGKTLDDDCSSIEGIVDALNDIAISLREYLPGAHTVSGIGKRKHTKLIALNCIPYFLVQKEWFSSILVNWCETASTWSTVRTYKKFQDGLNNQSLFLEGIINDTMAGNIDGDTFFSQLVAMTVERDAVQEDGEDDERPPKRSRNAITPEPASTSIPTPSNMFSPPHMASSSMSMSASSRGSMLECPITMQPIINPAYLNCSCKNMFEESALRTWLSKKKQCPSCKKTLRVPIVNVPHNNMISATEMM